MTVYFAKRALDILFSVMLVLILSPLFLILALIIKVTSKGPILHWSSRVGQYNRLFLMPKFRTMQIETPQVATHLLADPAIYLTSVGAFLRRTSLDELAQLFSILWEI